MAAAAFLAGALLRAFGARLFSDHSKSFLDGHHRRVLALRQRGIDLAPIDVGAVFAVAHRDNATIGMLAKVFESRRRTPATSRSLCLLVGKDCNSPVETDRKDVFRAFQIGIGAIMRDVGAIAPDPGGDHLGGFRVLADITRQGQQCQCLLMIDRVERPALWQAGALGFLAFAALDIRTKPAIACGNVLVGVGVLAEQLRFVPAIAVFVGRFTSAELARELAFGIVRATDEGAVFAELQRKISGTAELTDTGIAAVFAWREDERSKLVIQRIQYIGDAQFLDTIDGSEEIRPEIAQDILPLELAIGNLVELFFKISGEVIFDVTLEETFQERDDQPALGLRDQLALVDRYVFAVAQGCERRCVGGRAANAELFHLLDKCGFRIARRRFGRMLGCIDLFAGEGLAGTDFRKTGTVFIDILFLAVIHIGAEEAIKSDD